MKLEQQVCSLELSKRLKELGVKQASIFRWQDGNNGWAVELDNLYGMTLRTNHVAAFTVAELGEKLPARLEFDRDEHSTYRLAMEKQDTQWNIVYICADCRGRDFEPMIALTEADARAKCLIYLLENNLIT